MIFKNHFITFSCNPQLVEIKGKDIYEKVKYCETFAECANTDIQAVFDLVLSTAVKNKTLPEDMPSKLYIISDMEFDYCAENSTAPENAVCLLTAFYLLFPPLLLGTPSLIHRCG